MDMKRDYYEDVQLFSSGVVVFWFALTMVFLALFPFLFKNYYVYMANYMAINIIVAIGVNLLVGYTGQISLGHAGFFAIGAYGTIILMTKAHFPFLLALPVSALATALFGGDRIEILKNSGSGEFSSSDTISSQFGDRIDFRRLGR